MKMRQAWLENMRSGNLVWLLLSLSFFSIITTGIISYNRISSTVSTLKNRINEDFELNAIKSIRSDYEDIDNMLEMYLITHRQFYLQQVDSAAKKARYTINELRLSDKIGSASAELLDSLKLYLNSKAKNIQYIVRYQQDVSIEKLIEDYENMQSIRSAIDRAEKEDPLRWKRTKQSGKTREKSKSSAVQETNPEKQNLEQMAEAGRVNPYLEIDHELNLKMAKVCKTLETSEIERMDSENRHTEHIIREANASVLLLGACTAVFILLAGILYFRYVRQLAQIGKNLAEAKDIAEEMTMIKERFMANMSHEIRTPLNAISGFIDQLQASGLNPRQQKQSQIIQKSIQHILDIINDILDFSKLNAKKLSLEYHGFEPAKTIRQTIDLLDNLVDHNSVQLTLNLDQDLPSILIGDAYRLRQILLNIIGNAIKYTRAGSIEVLVNGERDAGGRFKLRICVTDTGIGIDEAELENIFKEFHMADNARWSKAGSSGLGLSITKMLIELFNGKISIESKINQGSKVCIELPLGVGTISDLQPEPTYLSDLSFLENKKIIIADDEPFNRTLLNNILHKYNAKTTEAENGHHVLSILEQTDADCILMDVKMPELNGLETTRLIRAGADKTKASVPIIAVTAALTPEHLKNFRNLDVKHFLEKPFKESELLNQLYLALKPGVGLQAEDLSSAGKNENENEALFDLSELKKQSGNNPDFIREMTETLLNSTRQGITEIESAMASGDMSKINLSAHRIASPLRFIRAERAYKCIKQIEYLTESGEEIPAGILQKNLNEFKNQFDILENELTNKQEKHPLHKENKSK